MLLINREIAKRFPDVVNMRSLTVLCISYCAYVAATILLDISAVKFEKDSYIIALIGIFL